MYLCAGTISPVRKYILLHHLFRFVGCDWERKVVAAAKPAPVIIYATKSLEGVSNIAASDEGILAARK